MGGHRRRQTRLGRPSIHDGSGPKSKHGEWDSRRSAPSRGRVMRAPGLSARCRRRRAAPPREGDDPAPRGALGGRTAPPGACSAEAAEARYSPGAIAPEFFPASYGTHCGADQSPPLPFRALSGP